MKPALALSLAALFFPPLLSAQATLTAPPLQRALPNQVILTLPYTARLHDGGYSGTVTDGAVSWQCGKGYCRTTAAWSAPTVGACSVLAAKVGTLTSFGHGTRILGPDELADCNRSAGATAPVQALPTLRESARTAPVLQPNLVPQRREQFAQLRQIRQDAATAARDQQQREAQARRSEADRHNEQRRQALGLTHAYNAGDDCDDLRSEVNRLAAEVCDNLDNNCNRLVDEGQQLSFFLDADGDGHGDPAQRVEACPADQRRAADEGQWLVQVGNDCDDSDSSRWQGCP